MLKGVIGKVKEAATGEKSSPQDWQLGKTNLNTFFNNTLVKGVNRLPAPFTQGFQKILEA